MLLLIGVWIFFMRQMQSGKGGGALGFGRSKAKLLNENKNDKIKEGLNEYEWRWKTKEGLSRQRFFSKPLWNRETSLKDKKILLWSEQGIGDTINWSSKLPYFAEKAKHCILECQEKLVPLLQRSFPDIEVIPENRILDSERDDFDFHLPMGSLYKHFIEDISQNPKIKTHLILSTKVF